MARIVYTDISGQERSVPFGSDAPVVSIGRATDCTIRSNRKSVSRRHAELRFSNGQFEVIDLNSSNGTYLIIDDERKPVLGREFLAPNDEVWCGDFILHFVPDEEDDVPTYNAGALDYQTSPTSNALPQDVLPSPEPFGSPSGFDNRPSHDFGLQDFGLDSTDFDSPAGMYENHGVSEESSVAWGQTAPPSPVEAPDTTIERSSEVDRLKAELASIHDLTSRQASELEDFQSRLDDERRSVDELRGELELVRQSAGQNEDARRLQRELDDLHDEKRRLEEKLHVALQQSDRAVELERQLDEARRRNSNLEVEVDEATRRATELENSLSSNAGMVEEQQRLREDLLTKNRDLESLQDEVERLQHELVAMGKDLSEARKVATSSAQALEETDALRREIERHSRLVEEFERRNRELQAELQEADAEMEEVRRSAGGSQERLDDVEAELETSRHELERFKAESAGLRRELETLQAAGSIDDLRAEIEGLKTRLKLEKDRARSDDRLADENLELKERIAVLESDKAALASANTKAEEALDELESASLELRERLEVLETQNESLREELANMAVAPEPVEAEGGLSPEALEAILARVDALERIVDAIDRANLEPLSTVDRVRLQSALKDTAPKRNLKELKSLLAGDE